MANSPSFEDKAVLEFFETSGRNLVAAEATAGVRHHIALPVVGTEPLLASGYFRAKMAQENLIKASPVPFTIVRATHFFEFVGGIAQSATVLAEAELAEVLATRSYERCEGRRGYRNGKRQRSISTGLGATVIEVPRARIGTGERETEWQSGLIARYQGRAASVDQALLGCYLSGANGRRIRGALSPLLRGAPLSKSAISRLVGRLQALFTQWRSQSLATEAVVFLYLDAIVLRVRIAKKVISCRCWWGWESKRKAKR